MPTGRRLLALLVVCVAVALPAGVLHATCAGKTCDEGTTVQARIPFCPLPDEVKTLIASGYYEGRSPDVIGVGATPIAGGGGEASTPWPEAPLPDVRVPLAFLGTGVDLTVALPEQLTLDRIAPTLKEILGVEWKFPDVHGGLSITGLASGERPRLVLEVVWTGGGTSELEADPTASAAWRHLTAHGAVASTEASAGSLPLDPVAALTTIGAGGLPVQHGITGGLIRDDDSNIVRPWSEGAPTAVIASLPDDLVAEQPATKVGAVLPSRADHGVVGGTWYVPGDIADVTLARRDPARAVHAMLAGGFGADDTPDVLAVVIGGPASAFADAMRTIVPSVRAAVPATTVVVTATGSRSPDGALTAAAVADHVNAGVSSSGPIVESTVPGGLFLDQDVLAADGLSSGAAVQPMLGMRDGGRKVFADAFPRIRRVLREVLLMAVDTLHPQTETDPGAGGGPASSGRHAIAVVLTLAAAGLLLRLLDPSNYAWLQNFLIVFSSLLVEALPFILLGALVSAAIEVFVPSSAFARIARLPRPLQLPAAAMAGVAFPVCECGSVPVARRLVSKGLAPGAAVTFMLAAPILNPVVVASTYVAYRGRDTLWTMVLGRMALGFVVAVAVGWVVGRVRAEDLLRPRPGDDDRDEDEDEPRWSRFFGHLTGDFVFMGRFLVMGAAIAAAVQTFVPQSVIGRVAGTPVLDLVAMMVLAFLLSLCSESDAFVAASFVQFGPASQLAFLVSGPMVDMKLAALYVGTYSKGFFRTVVITVFAVTLAGTMWIQVVAG